MRIRKATQKDMGRINEIVKEGLFQEWLNQYLGDAKKIKEDVESDFNSFKCKSGLSDHKVLIAGVVVR
jgi:hypothetical protein